MHDSIGLAIKELQDKHNKEMQELKNRINEKFAEKQAKIILNVAKKIREYRHENGLSQQNLADKIGLTRAAIANMEQANQDYPLSTLIKISIVLKVDVKDLLE